MLRLGIMGTKNGTRKYINNFIQKNILVDPMGSEGTKLKEKFLF